MARPGPRTTYRYSEQFKATAVRLSQLPGVAVRDVAESLYIHPFMLSLWRKQTRGGQIVTNGVEVDKALATEREIMPSVSPKQIAESLTELWSPRVVGEVDDAYIKVAKVHGSLAWHSHENEDELFFVLGGSLRIEMEGGAVELDEGEMFIVPKGVRHNPVAEHECLLMIIEQKSTLHTGDVKTAKTRSLAEQLRPL